MCLAVAIKLWKESMNDLLLDYLCKYWQIHVFTYLYVLCLFTEKGEFNRKVCVHCNATFHSGVSLSNHLRAYAKRKRNALLEGTSKCHSVLHTNQDANPKSTVAVEEDANLHL